MRRRAPKLDPASQPPAELLTLDPDDWLIFVDPRGYDPNDHRNIRDRVPFGEPYLSFENWRLSEAWALWTRARHEWCDRYGWPGGRDVLDLLREEAALTFAGQGRRRSTPM